MEQKPVQIILKPNMTKLSHNTFIVRTQAGFRKALKDYKRYMCCDKMELSGYPKIYPSLVVFSMQYRGYEYIVAHCTPVNDILKHI